MDVGELLAKQKNEQDNLKRSTVDKSFTQNQIIISNSVIELVDLPLVITGQTIGHSWIVGSPTNGRVGTNTSTYDGSQQVVGSAGRVPGLIAISNPNYVWRTLLTSLETAYWNASGTTTCTVDTANQKLDFTAAEIFQSNRLSIEFLPIMSAILSVSNIVGSSNLTYYLSADNGSNWEEVSLGVRHYFTNVGSELKIKIVASDTASISINNIYGVSIPLQIKYAVE
jgi:hypothetical protein